MLTVAYAHAHASTNSQIFLAVQFTILWHLLLQKKLANKLFSSPFLLLLWIQDLNPVSGIQDPVSGIQNLG